MSAHKVVHVDPYVLLDSAVTQWSAEFDERTKAIDAEQFFRWFDMWRCLAKQSLASKPE